MVYRGIVKGKVIELEGKMILPEGTEVEIVVKEPKDEEVSSDVYPKGSPQAILAALDTPPHCAPEDVDILLKVIEEGKSPLRFEGVFD